MLCYGVVFYESEPNYMKIFPTYLSVEKHIFSYVKTVSNMTCGICTLVTNAVNSNRHQT
jgi:hypothetical protein